MVTLKNVYTMSNLLKSPCNVKFISRNFTITTKLSRYNNPKAFRPKAYRKPFEEPASSQRNERQILFNKGRGLIPFNKKLPITGKNTGPGVEGGSEIGQKLAAVHKVHPTGFVNKYGQFIKVKDMVPEFVVPNLKGFSLKPYVPYTKVSLVENQKHSAREIFDEYLADSIREKYISETSPKKKSFLDRFRK